MILFEYNGIKFDVCKIGGGKLTQDIALHSHSKNSYELHFITNGQGTLITDEKEYKLKKGCFFVTGPHFRHAHKSDKKHILEDIFIYIQKVGGKNANLFSNEFLTTDFFITDRFDSTIAKAMFDEYKTKKFDYKTAVSGLAMKLITDIVRCYFPKGIPSAADSDNLYEKRFMIIEEYFLYNNNLSLTDLSDKIGLCPRQTQRLLNKYYGKNFREKKKEILQSKSHISQAPDNRTKND